MSEAQYTAKSRAKHPAKSIKVPLGLFGGLVRVSASVLAEAGMRPLRPECAPSMAARVLLQNAIAAISAETSLSGLSPAQDLPPVPKLPSDATIWGVEGKNWQMTCDIEGKVSLSFKTIRDGRHVLLDGQFTEDHTAGNWTWLADGRIEQESRPLLVQILSNLADKAA